MKVSIVMPTYNTPKEYLIEAINSILNQTFSDFELIIVDDKSTYPDANLFWDYIMGLDSRIKVIQNKSKKSVAGALNTGIDYSTGKYIFRMDADDISDKDRLKTQVTFMEKHLDVFVLASYAKCFGASNKTLRTFKDNTKLKASLLFHNELVHPSICIRTEVFKTMGYRYDEEIINEDYDLWLRLSLERRVLFASINKSLIKYRIHQNQLTHNNLDEILEKDFENRKKYLKTLCPQLSDDESSDFIHYTWHSEKVKIINILNAQKKMCLIPLVNEGLYDKQKFKKAFWLECFKKSIAYSIKMKHFSLRLLFNNSLKLIASLFNISCNK